MEPEVTNLNVKVGKLLLRYSLSRRKNSLSGLTLNPIILKWNRERKFLSKAIDKDGSIFDPACGTGATIYSMGIWSQKNIVPYGIEIHPTLVKIANNIHEGNFICGDFCKIRMSGKYDYVYFSAFHNFTFKRDEESYGWIKKIKPIVKYRLIVSGYYFPEHKEFYQDYYKSMDCLNNLLRGEFHPYVDISEPSKSKERAVYFERKYKD